MLNFDSNFWNVVTKTVAVGLLAMGVGYLATSDAKAVPTKKTVKEERYIIKEDGGGSVSTFQESLKYISSQSMKIKIDGYCASACTLILDPSYKLDVCVTPKVKFGFHQPYAMDGLGRVHYTIPFIATAEKVWKEIFYKRYPDWVREKIDANGGVPAVYRGYGPSDVFWIEYKDLNKYMRTCIQ